jgi:hypothetical protein
MLGLSRWCHIGELGGMRRGEMVLRQVGWAFVRERVCRKSGSGFESDGGRVISTSRSEGIPITKNSDKIHINVI